MIHISDVAVRRRDINLCGKRTNPVSHPFFFLLEIFSALNLIAPVLLHVAFGKTDGRVLLSDDFSPARCSSRGGLEMARAQNL